MTAPALRRWQALFLERHAAHPSPDFLLVATPGAGKTLAAALAVRAALDAGRVAQVVVVCPTTALRAQWADAADRAGLILDPRWRNADGRWRADAHGVAVTYQQVASAPDLFAHHLATPTAVVIDECHHTGEAATWGTALRTAFDGAPLRLALSGTPFRSDSRAIPFVTYDDAARCVPDHVYGYAEAVADGACRPVAFRLHDGTMRWRADGEERTAAFADDLDPQDDARRLRTAIDASTPFLATVLAEADGLLVKARRVVPDAAGLVLADTRAHAREIAALLRTIADEKPAVVLSDDPGSHARIARYAAAAQPRWIVAVGMVSEGVDIPRLAVAVYATVRRTELFFRQAIGRVVRRRAQDPDDLNATVYLPADGTLVAFAQRVELELRHELRDSDPDALDVEPPTGAARKIDFDALDAHVESGGMIVAGARYSREEVVAALRLLRELGQSERALRRVLGFVRREGVGTVAAADPQAPADAPAEVDDRPAHRRVAAKRQGLGRLARRLAQLLRAADPAYDHARVQAAVNRAMGVGRRAEATEAQLDRGLVYVRRELDRLSAEHPDHAEALQIPGSVQQIERLMLQDGQGPARG